MYTLINGSPKINLSNSNNFLNKLRPHLNEYNIFHLIKSKKEEILKSIKKSEVIVFSFPLYVDSPPSMLLEFLDYIIDNKINLTNKLVYIIINCGFREGIQNKTAIDIMKNWCNKTNAKYASSILIGAGEIVGKEKYKFISNNATNKLKIFNNYIKNKEIQPDIITTVDILDNRLYCLLANISWTNHGKKHRLSKTDIKKQ